MKKHLISETLFTIAIATGALALSGCGVVKAREDRVVVAAPGASSGSLQAGRVASNDSGEEEIRQIKQFLDLYTDHGAVSREGLAHFIEKYKAQIMPFLSGVHMTSQELIDLIFQFDSDHDGHVTPREISDGLMKRVPILRWIPDNTAEISREELDGQIAQEYPQASPAARAGLGEVLMRFDENFAEGNSNGKISRSEVSGAGMIIGILAQTDFSNGITILPGAIPPVTGGPTGSGAQNIDITPLAGKLLQQKVDQQLLGRYAVQSSKQLSPDDLRLEWMQLALKFFLADKLVHHFAPTDGVHAGQLSESLAQGALSAWGIPQLTHWSTVRGIYDNAMMAGDGDGYLNSMETFNYLTDLDFAHKVRGMLHGDFSAKAVAANPQKQALLATFFQLFPRTGTGLFTNDDARPMTPGTNLRTEYWNNFTQFDDPTYGGNNDGAIDDGEVAMGLLHARLVEFLYELFDTNHDSYLVRGEGNKLFQAFGITDKRVIDAFYADIGLNASGPNFWQKLKLFFSGDHGWKWLRPYDFHVRLVQVLPRLLTPGDRD